MPQPRPPRATPAKTPFAAFFRTEAAAGRIVLDVAAQADSGWFTAPAFRHRVRNGRKVAIEILDFFGRLGLTLHKGDLRRLNPGSSDLFDR